jgi:hypothetical protein
VKGSPIDYDAQIRESFKRIAASHPEYDEDSHFDILMNEYSISEADARAIVNRGKMS